MQHETFLVLGGGGMVGAQVVDQICKSLSPRRVIIASLYQAEVDRALDDFRRDYPAVEFIGFWGDVFLRAEWNAPGGGQPVSRAQLVDSAEHRAALYADLFGDLDSAYARSQLAQLVREHRPDVVVDSINTATAISYQDVYSASIIARQAFDRLADQAAPELDPARRALDLLLISQSVPQLIRHVLVLHRAMIEAGARLYLKIGTTGTGGLGMNIPYTHSEDKPSAQLMTKTAIAFAHTGLMFLMARTAGGPVVKEIKPGAMIGYADIGRRAIRERGRPVRMFTSRAETLGPALSLRQPESGYRELGALEMVVADTGENGLFAKGEFETITHLRQMEFITPEEIARQAMLEIRGSNTGYDVIAAVDGAVMNPTYRAGYLRQFALGELARLEKETGTHSVALGQLGPPELGKLLWEAHLLGLEYGALSAVLAHSAAELAARTYARLQADDNLRQTITSVGLPILAPDGQTLIRGPFIRIPEVAGADSVPLDAERVEQWARKGWVDLRPASFQHWLERLARMQSESRLAHGRGSAAITRQVYLSDEISIGAVVGWILNNEMNAYRIK